MNRTRQSLQNRDRVSATAVAEIAGVGPSAVSNWRKRHPDFPLALPDSSAGTATFRFGEIISWLEKHGKRYRAPRQKSASTLWKYVHTVRGTLRPDGLLEFFLQLLVLRHAYSASNRRDAELLLAQAWRRLLDGEVRPAEAFALLSAEVRDADAHLARALRPQHGLKNLNDVQLSELLRVVDETLGKQEDAGSVATDLLRGFNDKLEMRAEFSTHVGLENLMTALLLPIEGSILDPACGAAMLLARAWAESEFNGVRLYGQEVVEGAWRLGYLHLRLQGAEFEMASGDTLRDDQFWALKADRVMVHPPFGQRLTSEVFSEDDPRWVHGVPTRSTADFAWVQHLLYHLADGGIGVITTPSANLERGGHTKDLRAAMVRTNLLDAVIHLPPGLSYPGSQATVLLLFQRGRPGRDDRVLFIDGRQLGTPQRRRIRHFPRAAVDRVVDAVRLWRKGEFAPEAQFSAAATQAEIAAQDWYLGPNRYISYAPADPEGAGEALADRWPHVSRELVERLDAMQDVKQNVLALLSRIKRSDAHE